jgi:hypothetical protein
VSLTVQSFQDLAFNAARNRALTEPLRFAAQRFGELLDPHAHFAAAASFTLDPVTALSEFIELARAHDASAGNNPSHGVMIDVIRRTRAAVAQDPNLAAWYPSDYAAVVGALDLAVDWGAATAAKSGKKAWLMAEAGAAARGPVRTMRASLLDPQVGYRPRLVSNVCGTCSAPTLSTAQWLRFDRELQLMAAIALAEGRTGARLARELGRGIARSRDSQTACERVRSVLEASPEGFFVAFALRGVRFPKHLAAFGLRAVDPRTPRWRPGHPSEDDLALTSLQASCPGETILVASVTAFDFEHAINLAWRRGERLTDQYGAEHRVYRISVADPVLALRTSDHQLSEKGDPTERLHEARPRLRHPDDRLEQSLRYAALAREERAPVVQVLHSWIALETLVRGSGAPAGPYQFLMQRLAPTLAVHAVRQSLAATWHIASRAGRRGADRDRWLQIEGWLGVHGQHRRLPDLNKWVELMRHEPPKGMHAPTTLAVGASDDQASAVLAELLPRMVPFAREAVLRWRWRLGVGNRLSNWCDEVHAQAAAALGRMYVMRNSTVHAGLTDSLGSDQLAHAAENIVDTVYEVLPAWLRGNDPAWKAFDRLHRRARHVHRTWNHLARPALLNAEGLTRPGGDGLSR